MPEATPKVAVKRKTPAGPKRASKADIKKIAKEMFGDEVEVFREQTQGLARALESRLAAEEKAAESRASRARKEYEGFLARQAVLQGQAQDLQAIVKPLLAENKAMEAAIVRFRAELQALGAEVRGALASAEKARRAAEGCAAAALTKEVHLADAVEHAKSLLADLEKGARRRLETQTTAALRGLSGAEERANQKTSAALKRIQEYLSRAIQAENTVAGTAQALRDEMEVLSGRFDAFMAGFRSLNR